MSAELANDLVEELLRLSAEDSIFGFIFPFCLLDGFLKVLKGPFLCCSAWVKLLQNLKQLLLLNAQEFDLGTGTVRHIPSK